MTITQQETIIPNLVIRGPVRAAQYVRMSTDLQQYSIQNQIEMITAYAYRRSITIVRSYADEGRSGLRLTGRPALQNLLGDVQSGTADFEVILVYDISRWGRFQDMDESAYYEQICKRAGIQVIYCAENFDNDDSVISSLIKSLKRVMAGEYSRELSEKVFVGQCNLVRRGYWQGAQPGYGLQRCLVGADGTPKGILTFGERKSIQSDRVILVPGLPDEIKTLKRIFQAYVDDRKSTYEIAIQLNAEGLTFRDGRPWHKNTIRRLLTNEKYAGHNVFNRVSRKLDGPQIKNPPAAWVRSHNAFSPIIDPALVAAAIRIDRERGDRMSNEEMLRLLKTLFQKKGFLTSKMIDGTVGMPHSCVYRKRFGPLRTLYERVGYRLNSTYDYIDVRRSFAEKASEHVNRVVGELTRLGLNVVSGKSRGTFVIEDNLVLAIVVVLGSRHHGGRLEWKLHNKNALHSNYIVAIRTDTIRPEPIDYYLLPTDRTRRSRVLLGGRRRSFVDEFRREDLAALVEAIRGRAIGLVGFAD